MFHPCIIHQAVDNMLVPESPYGVLSLNSPLSNSYFTFDHKFPAISKKLNFGNLWATIWKCYSINLLITENHQNYYYLF